MRQGKQMASTASNFDRRAGDDRRNRSPDTMIAPLAEALVREEIELLFQPYFNADDTLAGAEALARWEHPEYGILAGDSLVTIAQSGGMSSQLARYLSRAALQIAQDWPATLNLSLNVTAMDLLAGNFTEDILVLLAESGFAPGRLTLEITEQALVADLERSARKLRPLADIGVRIALDDFGAGYCNFRYLKVLPLHALKLDRSMIDGIATDPRDLAILRGIVAMAHALDLAVVAEGVETSRQRAVALQEGCSTWQGYLGAKPVSSAVFGRMLLQVAHGAKR